MTLDTGVSWKADYDTELKKSTEMSEEKTIPGFRRVPRTGVIYVMHRATEQGFSYENTEWANLGQGSPEVGPLEGAPDRVDMLSIDPTRHEVLFQGESIGLTATEFAILHGSQEVAQPTQ